MDYLIRREKADLDSTGYMEVGPGRYSGKHWQPGFLFVWEDAFAMAEGILAKHFPAYDHFSMNDIPKETGLVVAEEWSRASQALISARPEGAETLLHLDAAYRTGLEKELADQRGAISAMLKELAAECRSFYETEDWVCILGM